MKPFAALPNLVRLSLDAVLRMRIMDPVLFYPWIRDEFFPDPGSKGNVF
jgi:hypothetical protein